MIYYPGAVHACGRCSARVASDVDAVSVGGRPVRSSHVNPAGIPCEILTFSRVTHVASADPADATEEFTWFDGYAWRLAACAGCGLHLGWRYTAARPDLELREFYGLLVGALREAGDEDGGA